MSGGLDGTLDILLIGNPVAGRGRTVERVREFVGVLETLGHKVEVFLTTKAGDAAERAGSLSPDLDRLVIAGGDGTVNEVLNGLVEPSRTPLLHLPAGTANQLAFHLGLPANPKQLAHILVEGEIRMVDMGKVDGHRFLLQVSAGFDAMVTEVIHRSRTKTLGYRGYVLPIARALAGHSPTRVEILIDDEVRVAGTTIMVMKVRNYGRFFVFAEDARLDSGHFDVCVFRDGGIPAICLYALAGLVRGVARVPGVTRLTAHRIRIESSEPVPVQVDGTYFGTTPVDLELLASHVPVVVPLNRKPSRSSLSP